MAEPWTQKRLERVGREWQKRLMLQDWTLTFRLVNAYEVKGNYADIDRPTEQKRTGHIRVADPIHHSESMAADHDADPEYSLVHELLHLHLWAMKDAVVRMETVGGPLVKPLTEMAWEEIRAAEERAIDHIARALVTLKRKGA